MKKIMGIIILSALFVSLVACGTNKSLEKNLLEDGGVWNVATSDGDKLVLTLFQDGKATILEDGATVTDEGNYKIVDDKINFILEDENEVLFSMEELKTSAEGNVIDGFLIKDPNDGKTSIKMTK